MFTRPYRKFSSFVPKLSQQFTRPSLAVEHTQLFINNQYVDSVSGKTIGVYDPRNDETIVSVSEGSHADINLAVDAAYDAYHFGPWYQQFTATQRGRILYRFADLIEQNADELALLEAWDTGKVLENAKTEVNMGVASLRYFAGFSDKINGSTLSPDHPSFVSQTYREPIGVIGNILPWNVPLFLCLTHTAMALSCGNTIVHKPAETSPLSALAVCKLAQEAGIPEGVLNVVPGYGETAGQALCRNPKVGKITFTGDTKTGVEIMKTTSENLVPVSMELGGKSPCIVFPDADMDVAVNITQMGTFANAGQVCCASTRIFVHDSVYDEFVEKTIAATKQRKIGDNLGAEVVDQGPQQNKEQFNKVLQFLERGQEQGADLLAGGHRLNDVGNFVETTVFGNVRDDMDIARYEIFGPSMQILRFDDDVKSGDIDSVVRRANDTRYGLAAGVVTNDTNIIAKCRKQLQAGSIWVNCWNAFFVQAPFGGVKHSGFGRIGGHYTIDEYTNTKVQTQMIL
eukprot:CAMPEP_0202704258 /NCGR_PEP_ID=MMETSP1385-20130828/16959_1 /ASSEMBLY_ACC=CAM_ASM_000861 /TAXON_ID=933848 /ORGANISM="Elphidium margaritaceum" /LENGTH=512 /DNA_ID=CAMNT_0049362235 /DNA_START=59 /DNA_END=1597 /DNA_ORIENTATION=-